MKIILEKNNGALCPVSDIEKSKIDKLNPDGYYQVSIPLKRNYQFLKKVMKFFNFCFEHWDGEKVHEFASVSQQFESFRKQLTILAGYKVVTYKINGKMIIDAQSLSYESMSEEKFQEFYKDLTVADMKYIFKEKQDDHKLMNELVG